VLDLFDDFEGEDGLWKATEDFAGRPSKSRVPEPVVEWLEDDLMELGEPAFGLACECGVAGDSLLRASTASTLCPSSFSSALVMEDFQTPSAHSAYEEPADLAFTSSSDFPTDLRSGSTIARRAAALSSGAARGVYASVPPPVMLGHAASAAPTTPTLSIYTGAGGTEDRAAMPPPAYGEVGHAALALPGPGLLWSEGSRLHDCGECTPCKFFRSRRGCKAGTECNLCHFPHEELTFSAIRKVMRDKALAKRTSLAVGAAEHVPAPWHMQHAPSMALPGRCVGQAAAAAAARSAMAPHARRL